MSEGKAPSHREQLLRDVWQRWNEGERGSVVGDVTPDCELRSQIIGETFRGREGILAWMAELDQAWALWQLWLDQVTDLPGDRLLAVGGVHLEGRESGVGFDQKLGWILEYEGEAMSRMTTFASPEAAIAAAAA